MTTVTCFNECKEGWNMHNQQFMVAHGVQDEVRGVGGKIACPFFDSDSSVHIQDGVKGENASHRLFYVFALLFFCMRHLADSVQLQVSSVGRTLFKLAVKASRYVPFFSRSSPASLSSPLASSMSLCACVVRVCIALSQRLASCMSCAPVYCSPHQFFSLCVPPPDSSPRVSDCNITHTVSGGENAYGMGQGEG